MATKSSTLIECFDREVREKIAPFFLAMNGHLVVGESCFDRWPGPSTIKLRDYSDMDGRCFWWINRFVIGETIFEIGYGDRELLVETAVFYVGVPDRFTPWLLLSAAGVREPQTLSGASWVLELPFMIQTIDNLAQGLRSHWEIIRSPVPELIDRARVLLGRQMLFNQEEQRRRDRERACAQASLAFHAGRFAEAARLLEPFREDADLPPSSAKLHGMAKRRQR